LRPRRGFRADDDGRGHADARNKALARRAVGIDDGSEASAKRGAHARAAVTVADPVDVEVGGGDESVELVAGPHELAFVEA
jgi:hypothetical protein